MKSLFRVIPAACVGITLLVGFSGGTAVSETRNRALERLVAKSGFSSEEGVRLQRAFAAALQAGVEERDALALVEVGLDGEFKASQALRLLSLAAQLALEGLPIEGFLAKVEEGVSKRVPPDRVVQAAERQGLMLNKAKGILNALVLQGFAIEDRDELLPDLAAALGDGRTPEEARAILADALRDGERPSAIRRKLFP